MSPISSKQEYELALKELAERLEWRLKESMNLDGKKLVNEKIYICKKYRLDRIPRNSEIITYLEHDSVLQLGLLRRKSVRTRSGIAVVTVITKPYNCPHGTCIYCPGGVRFGTPQSYTKNSPAAVFGIERNFDPLGQVSDAIMNLEKNGHDTSKIELIVLGGTVLAMPREYQEWFIKKCYEALNGKESTNLQEAIKENEFAAHRCVGLTIETKPDWCKEEHVDMLLSYGATRVEIGVQTLQENIIRYVNRGHALEDTVNAFRIAKDSAFKTVAHMMPRLPLSTPKKDLEDLMTLVTDQKYMPDMLKIYPTLVIKGTALYKLYKLRKYEPYDEEELIDMLCKFKSMVPPWVRIMRIQREIPEDEIVAGVKTGNIRQIIRNKMLQNDVRCRCIRCREIGHKIATGELEFHPRIEDSELIRREYESSNGKEIFLSFEDKTTDTLFGFLRLRIPSGREHRIEIKGKFASLVRELHIFGQVVPVGKDSATSEQAQHRGLGSRLLAEAERISKEEFKREKQIVIASAGTKEYYRKRGYIDEGPYVSKRLIP